MIECLYYTYVGEDGRTHTNRVTLYTRVENCGWTALYLAALDWPDRHDLEEYKAAGTLLVRVVVVPTVEEHEFRHKNLVPEYGFQDS